MVIRMRLVISGANGFLGTNIVKKALEKNIELMAITRKVNIQPGVIAMNIEDFLRNGYPCDSDDVFINCLFPTNADGYKMADGLGKVYQLIYMARKSGVGAFINISSQSVYASQRVSPAKEGDSLSLETPYAVGKYSSEVFVNQLFGDIPHTNIRMASLLGVGYDQRIINRMVDQVLRGDGMNVVGGMQRYGFLDVRDAADGIVKMAVTNPKDWKQTYNLGRMESYTLLEVAETIVDQMKKHGIASDYVLKEGTDVRNSSIDAKLFMTEFMWEPRIPLSRTVADIIECRMKRVEE